MNSIRRRGGFSGGLRKQGGWIGAAIGLATSLFGASKAKKEAKRQREMQERQIEAMDPYAPYRKEAAERLSKLSMADVVDTPEYKARQVAAERLMASQGYTGSGNAIVAAAEAGGASYQQAFDNLARLAGVDKQPGAGYDSQASNQTSQNYMNNLSSAANSIVYSVGQLFNKPANAGGG